MKNTSTQPTEEEFAYESATYEELRSTPLFKGVDSNVIRLFLTENFSSQEAAKSRVFELEPKDKLRLTRHGIEYLYIIVNGHLSLYMHSRFKSVPPKKKEPFFIAWRGEGQVIGEMTPISREVKLGHEMKWSSGADEPIVVTAQSRCKLIEIPSAYFIQIADDNAILYKNLVGLLIQKSFEERKRWDLIQSVDQIECRMAYVILMLIRRLGLSEADNEGCRTIEGFVTAEDIGGYLGRTRQSASTGIGKLGKRGLIEGNKRGHHEGTMKILDIDNLTELAPIEESA
jgi:CRP-like cAMP-binding protein